MQNKKMWIFFTGLLLAWLTDFFFWSKIAGLAFPIWIIIAVFALILLAVFQKQRIKAAVAILLAIAVSLSTLVFFRQEPLTRFIATLLSVGLLSLAAADILTGNWLKYAIQDYVVVYVRLLAGSIVKPIKTFYTLTKKNEGGRKLSGVLRKLVPVLVGLVIAIPIMAVLTALLVSADMVFLQQVEHFFSFFNIARLPEFIFRGFYISLLAIVFFGVLLHAFDKQVKGINNGKPLIPAFLGWVEGTVVLVLINLLFLAFVFIQVRYLFGGHVNITEAGFTYAEYARRGFNELVMVSIVSILVYLVLATTGKQTTRWQKRLFSILNLVMFGLVLVILFSAFERLQLYENAYGFTRLRAYTHLFLYWMAFLFVGSAVLEVLQIRKHFALIFMIFVVGFSLTLGITNLDGFVAGRNIERAKQGKELDGVYLAFLSDDALPEMLLQYRSGNVDTQIKDALGSELACRIQAYQNQESIPWQSLTLADMQIKILSQNMDDVLNAYPVMVSSVKVQGRWQRCPSPNGWLD